MGCGEPLFIAAKSSDGLLPLYDVLHEHNEELVKKAQVAFASVPEGSCDTAALPLKSGGDVFAALSAGRGSPESEEVIGEEGQDATQLTRPIRVAIIGRPNVGKCLKNCALTALDAYLYDTL